jgi:hypothetical protein
MSGTGACEHLKSLSAAFRERLSAAVDRRQRGEEGTLA